MIEKVYFIYCAILSFSGFTFGLMAQHNIDRETKGGIDNGYDMDSEEGIKYFARKFEQWKAGSRFVSKNASRNGIIIALIGAILNLYFNSWWSSILLMIIAYFTYLQVVKKIKYRIQIISILGFIISIILITIKLILK
jgi:hypothetical protein